MNSDAPTVKHSAKINIWDGFSSMGTFPLCIFEHNMDGEFFVKILEVHLLAQANVFIEKNWFLVQDNDPNTLVRRQGIGCSKICLKTPLVGLVRVLISIQ